MCSYQLDETVDINKYRQSIAPLPKKKSYLLVMKIHNGSFSEEETNLYCVCKINGEKYRSKTTVGNNPQFNEQWLMNIPENEDHLMIEICKHNIFGQKIIIGYVRVLLKMLGINIVTKEVYKVISNSVAIGKMELSFKRISRHEEKKYLGSVRKVQSFSLRTSKVNEINCSKKHKKIVHRLYFLQQEYEKDKTVINSLFNGFVTMTIADIKTDIEDYLKKGGKQTKSIEQLGLSGTVLSCYPSADYMYCMWLFCFPDGIHLKSKKPKSTFVSFQIHLGSYCTVFITYYELDKTQMDTIHELFPNSPQTLYAPFLIGLSSEFPIYNAMRVWLKTFYDSDINSDSELTEVVQETLNLKSPLPGKQIDYSFEKLNNLKIKIKLPKLNTIPPFSTNVFSLFKLLGVSGVIAVWLSLLEEEKVIIFSKSLTLLGYAIDNFKTMMFPFEWCYPCFDSLPYGLLDYLESPGACLMGVHSDYKEDVEDKMQHENVVLVDLDNGTVKSNSKIRTVPKLVNTLFHELNDIIGGYDNVKNLYEDVYKDEELFELNKIDCSVQIALFKFINIMLTDYRKYLNCIWVSDNPVIKFSDEFVYNQPYDRKEFLTALIESQHFQLFLQNLPTREHHIFEDWQMNNVYLHSTEELVELYMKKYKPLTKILSKPTKKKRTDELKPLRLGKLNKEEKEKEKEKTVIKKYKNHLMDMKRRDDSFVFNNDLIRLCDIQIGHLIMLNENQSSTIDSVIFDILSDVAYRKTFLERLLSKTTLFTYNKKQYCLRPLVYSTLVDLFRQAAVFSFSQKDYITPKKLLIVSETLFKMEEKGTKKIIDSLHDLDIWTRAEVWNNYFNFLCGQKYTLNIVEEWKKMNNEEKDNFREVEKEDFIQTLTKMLRLMSKLGIGATVVNKTINFITSGMRFEQEFNKRIETVVMKECRVKSEVKQDLTVTTFDITQLLYSSYDMVKY